MFDVIRRAVTPPRGGPGGGVMWLSKLTNRLLFNRRDDVREVVATRKVKVVTGNYTVLPEDDGAIIYMVTNGGASSVITLPSAADEDMAGFQVTLISWFLPSAGVGHTVAIPSDTFMWGNGFAGSAGKGAVNSLATDRDGDSLTVVADGVDSYTIIGVTGTWARVV